MTVRTCGCGVPVYEFRRGRYGPDGLTWAGTIVLDTVDRAGGKWTIAEDGRTAVPHEHGHGYDEHACVPVPDGQGELFGDQP